jgi:hypothetical protein
MPYKQLPSPPKMHSKFRNTDGVQGNRTSKNGRPATTISKVAFFALQIWCLRKIRIRLVLLSSGPCFLLRCRLTVHKCSNSIYMFCRMSAKSFWLSQISANSLIKNQISPASISIFMSNEPSTQEEGRITTCHRSGRKSHETRLGHPLLQVSEVDLFLVKPTRILYYSKQRSLVASQLCLPLLARHPHTRNCGCC